jgi:DNA repair exonuclease SbcCD nuclease subunit
MIKRIIHAADVHIKTYTHHEHYRKQLQLFINDVRKQTNGYSIEEVRIVLTGDLVHQKINISNEQITMLSWFLTELSAHGKLIIIPGNHDFLVDNQDRLDSITPVVELLHNPNIFYYKDFGVYEDDNINWVVYSLYQENRKPEFTNTDYKLYIGLYHGQIQGMTTDLHHTFDDAFDKLNFVGCDIVLCGDIHKRQMVKLPDGTKIIMIGSLIQQDMAESINEHGYGLYDVEEDEYTYNDIQNESPFLHFKISDITDIDNNAEILLNDK